MRRSPDLSPFITKKDIPVTADGCISGSLIAGKGDKSPFLIIAVGQCIQKLPESIVNLKVVCLMADHVEKSQIASKIKIFPGVVYTDSLSALTMQITPITTINSVADNQGSGLSESFIGTGIDDANG